MSEVYTYQELRELALKHGIRDNKVHIGVWHFFVNDIFDPVYQNIHEKLVS